MPTITAIYENGVFRPTGPVDLPEGRTVRIEPIDQQSPENQAHLGRVYRSRPIGGRRRSVFVDRHNEHQPWSPEGFDTMGLIAL